nr:hypothetical protein [uncultured Actinoplanes sp.]
MPLPSDTDGKISSGTDAAAAARALTPFEAVQQVVDNQAAALLRGDQNGWLAAVDPSQPALRKRYQNLFKTLRTLKVTKFTYDLDFAEPAKDKLSTTAAIEYCFFRSAQACTDAPWFGQRLTFSKSANGWVISHLTGDKDSLQTPWENGDLVFAQGKRVVVGGPASLRGRLSQVVAAADKAASVDDKIAKRMRNTQEKYRIFIADDKAWKTWYGGRFPGYSVAYTIPLGNAGSDVVLHMSDLRNRQQIQITVQHEMAHVVTLSNMGHDEDDDDLWLMEGVAEYAGWLPLHAGRDLTMPILHEALQKPNAPKTIASKPIGSDAEGDDVDIFYGFGHYAVDCMVTKFGEAKAMEFIRLKLRESKSLDEASRTAYGKPFAIVDKSCVTWVEQHSA